MNEIIKTADYDIHIGSGILKDIGTLTGVFSGGKYRRVAVVTDDTVAPLYGNTVVASLKAEGYVVCLYAFGAGERSKTLDTLNDIFGFLACNGIARTDLVVALGGGVVGDTAGFAAATWLRGIDFVNVPTTLLSQTDSAVGGKTGVNIKAGKNLVGAFHNPRLVVADTDTLKTLSDSVISDGLGEVVKYGMIRSRELFTLAGRGFSVVKSDFEKIVSLCARIKADIVDNDFHESGERKILNFGHTFGHAVEKYYNFTEFTHGRAVAAGMSFIAGLTDTVYGGDTKAKLDGCLKTLGLPVAEYDSVGGILRIIERGDVFGEIDVGVLLEYCGNDKKRDGDGIDVLLCTEIGKCAIRRFGTEEFARFAGYNSRRSAI